ncbi:hypothetical protein CAPTEDRAFT_211641 [Capitella teleta]|uniref:Uncharacterized protein n=1 Tax=Capitella teleta TaxID=283909 RepID=R7TDM9_CAPTE|nr:hypothetical protein CAPTEDRAFT_211641 [Capitella teleta]|eukprot:ELT91622.1 hypothetical protein CAPTEDRAFT_211641 [Capitella teleta]
MNTKQVHCYIFFIAILILLQFSVFLLSVSPKGIFVFNTQIKRRDQNKVINSKQNFDAQIKRGKEQNRPNLEPTFDRKTERRIEPTVSNSVQDLQPPLIKIAIGLAITSANTKDITDFPFFVEFLPSFCQTASNGYEYRFYLGHDHDDEFFTSPALLLFTQNFHRVISSQCPPSNFSANLYILRCLHNHKPAWAQNDAMMEAYMDNCEYYYRVNDDIKLLSPLWTEIYIEILHSYRPPNIGVVGPENGDKHIYLNFEFVHRTHLDIFGFYYPRTFETWWADYWITITYYRKRLTKTSRVKLDHTSSKGRRYVDSTKMLKSVRKRSDLVIAMSVNLTNVNETLGAIRNAQLARFFCFKEWSLVIFCSKFQFQTIGDYSTKFRNKIEHFGGQVHLLDLDATFPSALMAYLAADDVTINRFIVRSPITRLSLRDEYAVRKWLAAKEAFHHIRDHALYSKFSVHLWGADGKVLRSMMNSTMHQFIGQIRTEHKRGCANQLRPPMLAEEAVIYTGKCIDMINQNLWELMEDDVLCHGNSDGLCKQLPVLSSSEDFIGRPVSGHGVPLNFTSAI